MEELAAGRGWAWAPYRHPRLPRGSRSLPGGAAASTVTCKGKTAKAQDPSNQVENLVDYRFTCNEKVIAYSVIVNRSVDYFDPEVEVFSDRQARGRRRVPDGLLRLRRTDSRQRHRLQGHGEPAGCHRPALRRRGDRPRGQPLREAREGAGFKAWLVVTTQELDATGKPFLISSEPFRLYGPGCPAGAARTHHRR